MKTDSTLPPDQTTNDLIDDLGYDTPPEETPPAEVVPPVEAKKVDEVPGEKVTTGYEKDAPELVVPPTEVVPPVEEKKPEDMTEEEKTKKEISDTIKNLGEGYDKKKIESFAVDNKLTPAQLAAYVKLTKEEDAVAARTQLERTAAQRKAWKEELANDPEFGGEHFDKNVDRVGKLLQNNMPNLKKHLTDKGGVLPPYIMKDLLAVSKALNPTTKFVGGEPIVPPTEDKNYLDDLYE